MSKQLAIHGGRPVRTKLFPDQNTMDGREEAAALRAIRSGRLSGYRANRGSHFKGGPEIQALQSKWATRFNADPKGVIACNSATSGLFIACAAIGLKPDDEVIVSPYSMTCSATIPIWFGARSIFADVEPKHFCVDPKSIERQITPRTKAIIAVDLFGQACDYDAINSIILNADHKIYLITDTAQAPGATYTYNTTGIIKHTGTTGDIGVFSLNFGKHMTSGEGGIIIAGDPVLRSRCKLVMNHGEAVINDYDSSSVQRDKTIATVYQSSLGLNLRMTEIQAAIAREQLKKLDDNINRRRINVLSLDKYLQEIPAIHSPAQRLNCSHVYYALPYLWDAEKADGLHRDVFLNAVRAELTPREGRDGEGVQIGGGYIKPIFKMPFFSQSQWKATQIKANKECSTVIDLWANNLFLTLLHSPRSTVSDMADVGKAFCKVWDNRNSLLK